jgi:hypothetical protein
LWALPTPTTFENVDLIFNLGTESLVLLYFVARWKVA